MPSLMIGIGFVLAGMLVLAFRRRIFRIASGLTVAAVVILVGASGPVAANGSSDTGNRPEASAGLDLFLMLDTSPSMLLPTTRGGMQQLARATASDRGFEHGCAFACHVRVPFMGLAARDLDGRVITVDPSGKRVTTDPAVSSRCLVTMRDCPLGRADGPRIADSFWLARNYGAIYGGGAIDLRIDAETRAARAVLNDLQAQRYSKSMVSSVQTFSFDIGDPVPLTGPLTPARKVRPDQLPDLASLQREWYANNCPSEQVCNNDEATHFSQMFTRMDATIAAPGNGPVGSNALLLLVTDGMNDEQLGKARHLGGLTADELAQCQALKRRGVRIAILYLEYPAEPLHDDPWSQYEALPHLGEIEPALGQCASAPGGHVLLRKVAIGEDLVPALRQLAGDAMRLPI